MNREDDEKLWDLLGHAAERGVSPFFARDVLRAVRTQSRRPAFLHNWLSLRRLLPASGMVAAAAAIVLMVITHNSAVRRSSSLSDKDPVAQIDPQDYDVVADLDELLASDDNLWDENSSL